MTNIDTATTDIAPNTPPAPKPGYLTTEFWFKLAAVALSALFASGVIPTSGPIATVAAIAATTLGALGYTVSRTMVKTAVKATGAALLLMLTFGAMIAPSCASTKHAATVVKDTAVAGKDAVVKCVKADAGPLFALTAELGADALGSALHVGGIDFDALVDKAVANGVVVGGCAGLKFLEALRKAQRATTIRALVATPNPIDVAEARIRTRLGGRWDLGDGTAS